MTPNERALAARIAAHTRWANTSDTTAATAPARAAFDDRFVRQADPDGVLSPSERARRADHLRRAYFSKLALRSAQARRKSKEYANAADQADQELAGDGAA